MLKLAKTATVVLGIFAFSGSAIADEKHHEGHDMVMHHMHMMLNEAAGMAARGSNLIMLGQMGMAGKIDELSIEKGKELVAEAKSVMDEVMKGDVMKNMHHDGVTGTNAMMAYTHKLGDTINTYIELVESMEAVESHQH